MEDKKTRYNYSPFGLTDVVYDDGSGTANPLRYSAREDDGTGLDYHRARYYSPQMGRFISEDPIRFAGGVNWYAYVWNSPLNWTDPFGLGKYDRYSACYDLGLTGIELWLCRRRVDKTCELTPQYCCKVDYDGCMQESEDCSTAKEKDIKKLECTTEHLDCISNAKPPTRPPN